MPADLAEKLDRPTVRNVGFIENVDHALMTAPVFLCLNNATPYKVNQSRYMHAWSLGACVVAHSDAALSLPGMVDGENALLGGDPDAIVERIARALGDRSLRRDRCHQTQDVFDAVHRCCRRDGSYAANAPGACDGRRGDAKREAAVGPTGGCPAVSGQIHDLPALRATHP